MKRYIVLLLSVLMVLGTAGFPAAVSALELPIGRENLPAKKEVLKFDDALINEWTGMTTANYTEEDGSQVTAGRMFPGALNASGKRGSKDYPNPRYWFADNGIDTDMSGYRTVNFRMYSEKVTNEKVNIVFQQTKTWGDGYLKANITIDWEGWETVSLNFGDMPLSNQSVGISENRVGTIYFNFGGWGIDATGNAATALAVSEIYLSNPYNEVKLDDGLVVWEFDSEEKVEAAKASSPTKGVFDADTTVTNMHGVSGKISIDKTSDISADMPARHLLVDSNQYQYLNLLVHSNKMTQTAGTGINIVAYDYAGNNSYVKTTTPVDWTGWKVVSIPLSKFNGNRWNRFKNVRINSGGWTSDIKPVDMGTELNFDLVWFSKEEPKMALKETTTQAGNTEMPTVGAAVSFQFNTPLWKIDETKLTLTKQGETDSESISCTAEGSAMTLAAQDALEFGTTYTLTVPAGAVTDIFGQKNGEDIVYSFTTQEQGLNAALPTLTDGAGNPLSAMPAAGETIKASTRLSNGLSEAKTATLILACYDENNRMVAYKTASKTVPANGTDTLTLEAEAAGVTVKAFVLDDISSRQPLYNGFAQAPAPASNGGTKGTDAQNASLTLNSAKLEEDQLFIAGKVDGALPRMAVIAVSGESAEEPLFLSPVMAEDSGAFSVETTMPEAATSGAYEVCVTARRIDGKQTATVHYINPKERDTLVTAVNEADAQKDVTEQLENQRVALGLPEASALFSHIAQTVFEQKPYADYASFTAMLEQAQTALAELNAATWAGYSELLAENPMILNGHEDEAYYNGLSGTGKAEVNRKIIQSAPFESFAPFRTAFVQAVADYKKDLEGSGGSSGGTGGSGSSGGGKKGGSSIGAVTLPVGMVPVAPGNGTQEPEKPEERFADLAAAEWARESVERLYSVGAISAAEQFRPNDSVTREEFVKLMVESLGLAKGVSAPEFADVAADAWYAPYVAVVQSMGIVTGYEDGRFGIGEQITRQDMAVMLSRTLETLDMKLSEGNAELFADDGEIGGYARKAVYRMQAAGIINGLGDGSFGPSQNASRAQAAKLLCGLLDLLAK